MKKRSHYTADQKAKIALEVLCEEETMIEIAGKYEVHQINSVDGKPSLSKTQQECLEKKTRK